MYVYVLRAVGVSGLEQLLTTVTVGEHAALASGPNMFLPDR